VFALFEERVTRPRRLLAVVGKANREGPAEERIGVQRERGAVPI
jgi:hypothetical protein